MLQHFVIILTNSETHSPHGTQNQCLTYKLNSPRPLSFIKFLNYDVVHFEKIIRLIDMKFEILVSMARKSSIMLKCSSIGITYIADLSLLSSIRLYPSLAWIDSGNWPPGQIRSLCDVKLRPAHRVWKKLYFYLEIYLANIMRKKFFVKLFLTLSNFPRNLNRGVTANPRDAAYLSSL